MPQKRTQQSQITILCLHQPRRRITFKVILEAHGWRGLYQCMQTANYISVNFGGGKSLGFIRDVGQKNRKTGNGNTNRALESLQRVTSVCRLYWDTGCGTTDRLDLFSRQRHQQTTQCGITTSATTQSAIFLAFCVLLTPDLDK